MSLKNNFNFACPDMHRCSNSFPGPPRKKNNECGRACFDARPDAHSTKRRRRDERNNSLSVFLLQGDWCFISALECIQIRAQFFARTDLYMRTNFMVVFFCMLRRWPVPVASGEVWPGKKEDDMTLPSTPSLFSISSRCFIEGVKHTAYQNFHSLNIS